MTYWDADLYPDVPEPIGATNITPAIRAIIPATTEGERPQTVHYRGTRHLHDLFKFASDLMPNFVVRVDVEDHVVLDLDIKRSDASVLRHVIHVLVG